MKPDDPSTNPLDDDHSQNEGEGSRTAARRYNADVRAFVARDHAPELGRAAAGALDSPEGPQLRAAEEQAKHVGEPTLLDRIKGLVNRARHAISAR